MTIHTLHLDTHDHGLADGCERCGEHTVAPWRSLDQTNLKRIWSGRLFTNNDRVAAARLRDYVAESREVLHRLDLIDRG